MHVFAVSGSGCWIGLALIRLESATYIFYRFGIPGAMILLACCLNTTPEVGSLKDNNKIFRAPKVLEDVTQ